MLGFLKDPFLVLNFSYHTLMTFPMMLSVILLSAIRHLICGNNQNWLLESDLQDIVDCGKKWLVDFNTENTQLVSFDQSNNTGAIEVKTDGSFLEEKIIRIQRLSFFSKSDWGSYIISIAEKR